MTPRFGKKKGPVDFSTGPFFLGLSGAGKARAVVGRDFGQRGEARRPF
jgi:hypothetical protein